MPKVIIERCPQNHLCPCLRACKAGAIKQSGYKAPEIDMNICTECGLCVKVCPMGAVVGNG
ncbi:MAG: 4Fe-4S binding protein [Candidatus Margulisiibacteriota bacterium]